MKTIINSDESGKQKPRVWGKAITSGFVSIPVMITVATSMLFGGVLATQTSQTEAEETSQEVVLTAHDEEELLWLARVLYSETKRYDEQVLVAWVVRNRVESGRWGNTYKKVILAKGQFSGMHPTDANYKINIQKGDHSKDEAWLNAVHIAQEVYFADSMSRPFSPSVKHFYSPISVKKHPSWAKHLNPVLEITDTKTGGVRFAFYAGV